MINPPPMELRPVGASNRINSLDIIRGIALLGILLMNVVGFGLAFAYGDPTNSGGSTGWNLMVWIMDNMLFEGTMRGLFTMLFGAGFILLTTRFVLQTYPLVTTFWYYTCLSHDLVWGYFISLCDFWFNVVPNT